MDGMWQGEPPVIEDDEGYFVSTPGGIIARLPGSPVLPEHMREPLFWSVPFKITAPPRICGMCFGAGKIVDLPPTPAPPSGRHK